jgi:hypothetical protein
LDLFLEEEGLAPGIIQGPGAVRLEGMGGLEVSVPDENNELNLSDYAGNVAGVVLDKDRWSLESWIGFRRRLQDPTTRERRRLTYGNAGTEVIYRSHGAWAVGGRMDWRRLKSSRLYGDTYEIRGPVSEALVNYRFFGRMLAGLRVGYRAENEDRASDDVFALRHRLNRRVGQAGLALLLGPWQVGATWDFERGEIEGKSRDPAAFHTDIFTWTRPRDTYGLQVIFAPNPRLRGGAYVRRLRIEGGEWAEISWSDRFPDNGSQEDFALETATFREKESRTALGTRWELRLNPSLLLGSRLDAARGDLTIREGINFMGSRRETDREWDWWRGVLGLGYRFPGHRGRVGVEVSLARGSWTERWARGTVDRTWQSRRVKAGAEMFWRPYLVLRGGIELGDLDQDVDAPATLQRGRTVSLGASYVPLGGLVQVDASFLLERWRWALEEDNSKTHDEFGWRLAVRYVL